MGRRNGVGAAIAATGGGDDDSRERWERYREYRSRSEEGRPSFSGRSDYSSRGGYSGRPDFSRGGPPSQPEVRAESGPKKKIELKPKLRVTIDLPTTFTAGDLDFDGQIGFYEWRDWKRGAFDEFLALDHNGDGFLTPRELQAGPREMPVSGPTTIAASPQPSAATPSPSSSSSSGTRIVQAVSASTSEADDVVVRRAESTFRLLDQDRDGNVSPEEWKRSSKLKPQFEAAGVDLSAPMPRDAFVQHYVRVTAADS